MKKLFQEVFSSELANKKEIFIEFEQDAVKLITEQRYKISKDSRSLGTGSSMLGRWKQ